MDAKELKNIVQTIFWAVVLVKGIEFALGWSYENGKKDALKQINSEPKVMPGEPGEPVEFMAGGEKFRIKLEKVKN